LEGKRSCLVSLPFPGKVVPDVQRAGLVVAAAWPTPGTRTHHPLTGWLGPPTLWRRSTATHVLGHCEKRKLKTKLCLSWIHRSK